MSTVSTQTAVLPPVLVDVGRNDESLRRFLHGLPGVEAVGLQARAAALATRAVNADARRRDHPRRDGRHRAGEW